MYSIAGQRVVPGLGAYPSADPSDFQWAGSDTGAWDERQRLAAKAADAAARQAPSLQSEQQAQDAASIRAARAAQTSQLAQLQAQASGAVRTPAQNQIMSQTQNAAYTQAGVGASYRGSGAGIAASRLAAAYGAAQARAQGSQALGVQQAQDQMAATSNYAQLANQVRQSDLAQQGMSQDQAYRQAQMEQQNSASNDQMSQYYAQQGFNVANAQMAAAQEYEKQDAYNKLGAAGQYAQGKAFADQQDAQKYAAYVGMAAAAMAAA